eukprot:GFYU01012435.1.p1 GENE.GFYU01012435.1~~GFYU01012435.1.p1  ORF type:complete len:146 (-),score=53.49 GFYU01012435.1:76-513(-)
MPKGAVLPKGKDSKKGGRSKRQKVVLSENAKTLQLPQATVVKLLKNHGGNKKINEKAKAAFSFAGGLFAFYLTNIANAYTTKRKAMTVSTADIMHALTELGVPETGDLQDFVNELRSETEKKKAEKGGGRKPEAHHMEDDDSMSD